LRQNCQIPFISDFFNTIGPIAAFHPTSHASEDELLRFRDIDAVPIEPGRIDFEMGNALSINVVETGKGGLVVFAFGESG
jgi:hypothetical protein